MRYVHALLVAVWLLCGCGQAPAAVLVQSAGGTYAVKTTLAEAATALDAVGKTVVITTDQTLTAPLNWPTDRQLSRVGNAKIIQGTHTVTYTGSTATWGTAQMFSGTGAVTLSPQETAIPQWFGAIANDSGNDSAAFRMAVAATNKVYVPAGVYLIGMVKLDSDTEFYGAGASTILRRAEGIDSGGSAVQPYLEYIVLLATNYGSEGTADIADNKKNIYVHDLQLDGRSRDFTPNAASYHNMSVNATTNLTVERVTFYDFIGDGVYLGSGDTAGLERHNVNVKFINCIFDGAGNGNRNGISVIDCDGIVVENSVFKNIGNATLSQSVGGIDFEPNNDWNINRHARVVNCSFEDISTTNTAAISVFNEHQTGLNLHDWQIKGCSFTRCFVGVGGSAKKKTPSSPTDNIVVDGCTFVNSVSFDIANLGFKGYAITRNTFRLDPIASTSYRGAIKLGQLFSGANCAAFDTVINDNRFVGLRPQFGMLALYGVNGLVVTRNSFEDITGIIIKVLSPAEAGTTRYLKNIVIADNVVNNELRKTGSVTTSSFLGSTGGINADNDNSFINTTCVSLNNLMNHGVPRIGGGVLAICRESLTTAVPTSGTWTAGDKLFLSAPAAGNMGVLATTSGTFGTLSGATADAENGSAVLTNMVDANDSLREGQYITISGDAAMKQIQAIVGTTVYLSGNYTGSTSAGLALSWSAPVFGNFNDSTASLVLTGAGSPEGAVTADPGTLYLRTDGSTSTTLYVKTSGTSNTGWTAK